jgi:glutamate formiminotransferase/formiminotetrahydrofolate cyclodeaminase
MIQQATKNAALVPFRVMETAFSGFELIRKMVETGNPESITDAAVGSLAIRSCIRGAFLNVKINSAGINDKELVTDIIEKGHVIENKAFAEEEEIIKKTEDLIKFRNRS